MERRYLWLVLFALGLSTAQAQTTKQTEKQDTVIISIAKTSKIIFTIQDRKDIEILKHYNFQELFKDVLHKLETNDTTDLVNNRSTRNNQNEKTEDSASTGRSSESADSTYAQKENESNDDYQYRDRDQDDDGNADDEDEYDNDRKRRRHNDDWDVHFGSRRWGRTWQSFNFDLGTNNFLQDGKFPGSDDLYAVRPWVSCYFGFASVKSTRLAKKVFLQWSIGMNWYNFKFENDDVQLIKTDDGVVFARDDRDVNFIKSKLTASYLNVSLIPMLDFGDNGRKYRFWDHESEAFRIGLGPYVAYRIGSHTKQVYNDGGREKDKDRDSFHLNNFRYGARLQVGYRSTDLFFNYDISELFASGKGPKLNAFSFGVIF